MHGSGSFSLIFLCGFVVGPFFGAWCLRALDGSGNKFQLLGCDCGEVTSPYKAWFSHL